MTTISCVVYIYTRKQRKKTLLITLQPVNLISPCVHTFRELEDIFTQSDKRLYRSAEMSYTEYCSVSSS